MKRVLSVVVIVVVAGVLLAACGPNKAADAPGRVAQLAATCQTGAQTLENGWKSADASWKPNIQPGVVGALVHRAWVNNAPVDAASALNQLCALVPTLQTQIKQADDKQGDAKDKVLVAVYDQANLDLANLLINAPQQELSDAQSAKSRVASVDQTYAADVAIVTMNAVRARDYQGALLNLSFVSSAVSQAKSALASSDWRGAKNAVAQAETWFAIALTDSQAPEPTAAPRPTQAPYVPRQQQPSYVEPTAEPSNPWWKSDEPSVQPTAESSDPFSWNTDNEEPSVQPTAESSDPFSWNSDNTDQQSFPDEEPTAEPDNPF